MSFKTSFHKTLKLFFLVVLSISFESLSATNKDADQVFQRWMNIQKIIPDVNITDMSNVLSGNFFDKLQVSYELHLNFLKTSAAFFNSSCSLTLNVSSDDFPSFDDQFSSKKETLENIKNIYELIENDTEGFVEYLINSGIVGGVINSEENRINRSSLIEKYLGLFNIIFSSGDFVRDRKYLFSVANRFFEYCFGEKDKNINFKTIISNSEFHPIARLLYTIIWYHLAGQGWHTWHQNALDNLKVVADNGKEIVYIAGGVDIYQMIKKGIYNIRIIDPILPTQPKYYSEGWMWLYRGEGNNDGVGDEIDSAFSEKRVLMRRVKFNESDNVFQKDLSSGVTADIPKGEVTWDIFENGNKVGQFVIERRLCEQKDFKFDNKKQLLVSFNELYFICLPTSKGGWGINPYKFDSKQNFIVKQLAKPVTTQVAKNMRSVFENDSFSFISLGTCVN